MSQIPSGRPSAAEYSEASSSAPLRAAAAALLCLAQLAGTAHAAQVAVYNKKDVVSAESVTNVMADLASLGHSAATFKGTTSGNWQNVLSSADVLLIPNVVQDLNIDNFGESKRDVVRNFVNGGGLLILLPGRVGAFASLFPVPDPEPEPLVGTGPDTEGFSLLSFAGGTAFIAGPAEIARNLGVRGVSAVRPGARPIYGDDFGGSRPSIAVYRFTAGLGAVIYLGWEWSSGPEGERQDGGWVEVLDLAILDGQACIGAPGSDGDADGVADVCDSCPADADATQADTDQDVVGDACDNCPDDLNRDQADLDGDDLGDVCDPDVDGDGVDNEVDLCPVDADPGQEDADADLHGDACDVCPAVFDAGFPGEIDRWLVNLEANFGALSSLVADRFDFAGGELGFQIEDGGLDMYDGGNRLFGRASNIPYTNGVIVSDDAFGEGSSYFTAKFPGLFVLSVANLNSDFSVRGDTGADGTGTLESGVLDLFSTGLQYTLFFKRIHGAGDPSINHIFLLPGVRESVRHTVFGTGNDRHQL